MNCKCGRPAHPLYNGRCEDCWVGGSSQCKKQEDREELGTHLTDTGSVVTPHVQTFGHDRFWHKHNPKSES